MTRENVVNFMNFIKIKKLFSSPCFEFQIESSDNIRINTSRPNKRFKNTEQIFTSVLFIGFLVIHFRH